MSKQLRTGYTTGSCAAGAAKAAALGLLGKGPQEKVTITLPQGESLTMPLDALTVTGDSATAVIIKDGGDDPDITTGLRICVEVRLDDSGTIVLRAGEGVGRVTLKGLKIMPGEPAINPVPRRMIIENVANVLPLGKVPISSLRFPVGRKLPAKPSIRNLVSLVEFRSLGVPGLFTPCRKRR